MGGWRNRLQFR